MALEHSLTLGNRQSLVLTGVTNVVSFGEREIALDTSQGPLIIAGEDLHITQLNLEEARISIQGKKVDRLEYRVPHQGIKDKSRNVLGRLLK
ncbi:MAG: sporulation protein YabP [Syntrophomonadaceae bacterium]|nr:sporulation protein YabP [Syntrophomonadaceae bacterium]